MIRCLALSCVGPFLVAVQDSTQTEEPLTIRAVQGDLHVWSSAKDKLELVKNSARVTPKDRIGTRKDKHGILVTEDGSLISLSEVEVGHEQGLALERTRDKLLIKLYKGRIVLETFQTGLRVETPGGVIEGERSYSVIQVDGGKTKVTALEGTLTFVNPLGTVKVEGGQESSADRSSKPSVPKPVDREKAAGEVVGPASALNLIKNPGFEDGLNEWTIEQIKEKNVATLENGLSHSGRRSVRLEINNQICGATRPGWLGFKQNLGLTAGKRYLIRAYLRQEIRTGAVKPFLSIEGKAGPKWAADPSDQGWVRVGGVFTAGAESLGYRASIETLIESDRFDAVVWADDFLLLELK